MKRNIVIALAAACALSLAACGSGSASSAAEAAKPSTAAAETKAAAETTAAEPKTEGAAQAVSSEKLEVNKDFTTVNPGKLTVGTSPDFAPYEFYHITNGKPELSGFDVALAKRLAADMGLELQIVPIDFDGILMELQSGNIDLGISGFSPSPERAQTFDFSDLYYIGGQAFVIRGADKDKYKSYADFDKLPVGAQNGSIQMGLAESNTPNANIIGLTKVTDIVTELVTGKLEGAFIETAVANQYIKNYPELMVAWDVPYDSEGSAVALKKGNDGLRKAVNAVISNALSDGSMEQYIAEAGDLASDESNVYEGQLDANGNIQK